MTENNCLKRNSSQISRSRVNPVQSIQPQKGIVASFDEDHSHTRNILISNEDEPPPGAPAPRRRMKRRCSKVGKMFDINIVNLHSGFRSDTLLSQTYESKQEFQVVPLTRNTKRKVVNTPRQQHCCPRTRTTVVGKMFESNNTFGEKEDRSHKSIEDSSALNFLNEAQLRESILLHALVMRGKQEEEFSNKTMITRRTKKKTTTPKKLEAD